MADDLNFTIKALGTQLKPLIDVVSKYPIQDQPASYARAINTLASMTGNQDPEFSKRVKLGIAVSFQRMGAHKQSIEQAARLVGAI